MVCFITDLHSICKNDCINQTCPTFYKYWAHKTGVICNGLQIYDHKKIILCDNHSIIGDIWVMNDLYKAFVKLKVYLKILHTYIEGQLSITHTLYEFTAFLFRHGLNCWWVNRQLPTRNCCCGVGPVGASIMARNIIVDRLNAWCVSAVA